jgi:leader peptidase (prepilin peptidase) / N-methyltransferase
MEMLSVFSILFGALIGSFLNVCICRLPEEQSIVSPGSHCPQCKKTIQWYDNIPVVSYLLLRGKCRTCQCSISVQYPLVEGMTALLSLLLFIRFGPTLSYFVYFSFAAALIVITVIDLYHQIIPDVISLPGIGAGLLASWFIPHLSFVDGLLRWALFQANRVGLNLIPHVYFVDALLGVLLGGGSLLLVIQLYYWLRKGEGMGGGDVKLLAMIGAFLGWKAVIVTIILSSLIGSIVGVALMIWKGRDLKYAIPFGPFLSLGAVIFLFYGENLIRGYLALNR